MELVFPILGCILLSFSALAYPRDFSIRTERDLRRDLFKDYDKLSRPVKNPKTTIELSMNVAALMIRDVNEKEQAIVVDSWIKMSWKDDYLMWDEKSYNNISVLRVPPSEIWKPDLALYTAINEDSLFPNSPTNVLVYSSGMVLWVPVFTIKSRCTMFNLNPKTNLQCNIKFGSWTFDGNLLNLTLSSPEVDVTNFEDINPDWKMSSIKSNREDKYYPCCSEPYPSLHFNVTLKRRQSILKSNEHISLGY